MMAAQRLSAPIHITAYQSRGSLLFRHPVEQAADGLYGVFDFPAAALDSRIFHVGRQKCCSSHDDGQLIVNRMDDLSSRHCVSSLGWKISSAWLHAIHLSLEESEHSFVQNHEILTIFFDLFQKPEE